MARNRKAQQSDSSIATQTAPVQDEAAKLKAEEAARKVRDDELATARTVYTAATGGRSVARDAGTGSATAAARTGAAARDVSRFVPTITRSAA